MAANGARAAYKWFIDIIITAQSCLLTCIGAMLYRLSNRAPRLSSQQVRPHAPCSAWGLGFAGWGMRPPRSFDHINRTGSREGPCAAGQAAGVTTVAPKKANQAQTAAAGSTSSGPWLIVGLGNPGPRYDNTRHNIGFMVVDALARSADIDMRKLEKSAAVGRGELRGVPVILAKPVTFMNNSGDSVAGLANFYKRILVISDDLDQPLAAVRLRQKGGHGGHNGLRSIIARLGNSQDFPRLKIGIGRPPGQMEVASYVLQPFRKGEQGEVDTAIAESLRIIDSIMALGMDKALSGMRV